METVSSAEMGLAYAVLALGLYISYSVLNFPDLSVDGTFPMGGAITAVCILAGVNPWLCLVLSFLGGAAAGTVTGLIHVKLKTTNLLSGIVMMTALYSINLVFIAKKASLSIFSESTIFNGPLAELLPKDVRKLVILIICVALVKILFDLYMKTKSGMMLRVCGANEQMVKSLNVDSGKIKMLGLAIANGFVALSGSIFTQYNKVYDQSVGTGSMVIGLVSVILGMTIFRKAKRMSNTTKSIIGAMLYYLCISFTYLFFDNPALKNLITAALFLLILIFNDKILKGVKEDA